MSAIFLGIGPNFLDDLSIVRLVIVIPLGILLSLLLLLGRDSKKGVSLGRWVMAIMVRDQYDPRTVPDFRRLLLRNVYLILWPIEFFVLTSSKEKQRMGDKAAKTIVLKSTTKPSKALRLSLLLGIFIGFFTFMLLFITYALKNSDAYEVAIHEIERNEQVIQETGGIVGYGMFTTGGISSVNGFGQAALGIKVKGNKKDVQVNVVLTKGFAAQWTLVEMTIE